VSNAEGKKGGERNYLTDDIVPDVTHPRTHSALYYIYDMIYMIYDIWWFSDDD